MDTMRDTTVDLHLVGLTDLQRGFVQEMARSGNMTEAARAGGYSEKGANRAAVRLLKDPRIQTAIERERSRIIPTAPGELTQEQWEAAVWRLGLVATPDSARVSALKILGQSKGFLGSGNAGDGARIGSITINYTAGDNLKEVKRAKSVASITSAVEEAVILAEDAGEPVKTAKSNR